MNCIGNHGARLCACGNVAQAVGLRGDFELHLVGRCKPQPRCGRLRKITAPTMTRRSWCDPSRTVCQVARHSVRGPSRDTRRSASCVAHRVGDTDIDRVQAPNQSAHQVRPSATLPMHVPIDCDRSGRSAPRHAAATRGDVRAKCPTWWDTSRSKSGPKPPARSN